MLAPKQLCDLFASFCQTMRHAGYEPTHAYLCEDEQEARALYRTIEADERFYIPRIPRYEEAGLGWLIVMTLAG